MRVTLMQRPDGLPDQTVEADEVQIDVMLHQKGEGYDVSIVYDADLDEHRIIVDDECVWSAVDSDS